MENKPFTITDGFVIQAENLERWKEKLNAECYEFLVSEVKRISDPTTNGGVIFKSGYDVPRGQDIDSIVLNYRRK